MNPILTRVDVRATSESDAIDFPFNVPALRELETLDLNAAVTLFVGENGSGKSTLLESIAVATGLPTIGSVPAARDATLEAQRRLAKTLKLVWAEKTHRGFFLRAEDFFGFAKRLQEMRQEFEREAKEMGEKFKDHSTLARMLAQGPARRSLGEMESRYGADLDAQSHGESFLALFQSRLVPGGLYLLDEPEVALSPQSQLAFLAMLKAAIDDGSQFLVATHSPILMAIPGATILSFDRTPVGPVLFEDIEHVNLLRDFLAEPGRFLRHLWI